MNFLNDDGVHQILNSPTSESNLLGQIMTKSPTFENCCQLILGISYHDAVHMIIIIMIIQLLSPITKPTDTHQPLHRTSCHPGHTKKGIPYSQTLRIRWICSEDRFFDDRVGEMKGWLCNRGYGEKEVLEQISKVRGRDRLSLLDRQPETKGDKRIPLVLAYHPALNKVYEILKQNSKLILVDDEHKEVFQNKIFLSFQRAKNLKDQLVRAKLPSIGEPRWLRVPAGAMAEKVARYATSSRKGIVLKIRTKTDLSKTFRGGITAIQKT